ncbi:hypothetical protein KP509_08G042600 [Ceratopteris richardii]|uniref:Pectinesterase n=1 Tax=Ceratopteris richardii TaxID=49495 RepID=A0A8T2U684_CERRI|nr:hypothetical protein KP509_08G042600 [Ceratopteris richardii]KAH7431318.1 hypothetical protein KP509_08G042600 [Ceratopteris richardii]
MASKIQVLSVSLNGSGDFRTVQEAVDAVPPNKKQRFLIRIAPGIYNQPVYIPKNKTMITLLGDSPEDTVLTWSNTAASIKHPLASSIIGTGTFGSGTVIVEGEDFIAQGITFENAAPKGSGQAVAIRVTADRSAFYGCRFLGWQDTVYLHYGRVYIRDCYVEGSVDFIFGNATVLLEHCHIHCKADGFITAQQRTDPNDSSGYVFLRCTITGNGSSTPYMYLGRPWGPHARVVFAFTYMDACIKPEGWHNWDKKENEKTAEYHEYKCYGPGSDTSQRVSWARKMSDAISVQFLSPRFVDTASTWLSTAKIEQTPFIPTPLASMLTALANSKGSICCL